MKKIVSIGRGGVGKTSFIALLAKCFREKKPILLIDADPDQSLAQMVGIDLEKNGIKTISDILFDVRFDTIEENLKSLALADKIDLLFNQKCVYEGDFFDFISIGTKWTEGCYCQPNNILKGIIAKIEKHYNYVLIDSPAGLEHLNRRITSSVDEIFAIFDPSRKAFSNAKTAYKLAQEIGIKFRNFYAVANHRFPDELLGSIEKETGLKFAGKIAYDADAEKFALAGNSLLDLKDDSPAFKSVKEIIEKAGYD